LWKIKGSLLQCLLVMLLYLDSHIVPLKPGTIYDTRLVLRSHSKGIIIKERLTKINTKGITFTIVFAFQNISRSLVSFDKNSEIGIGTNKTEQKKANSTA
jgi:ATP-dependent protease Clp ATPase subunit